MDGAYGAAAVFSDKHRDLVRGIELADSITVDPHKWLAVPFAAGVILTRHPKILETAFSVAAPYMPKAAGGQLRLARSFAAWLGTSENFELAAPPMLTIVNFRIKSMGLDAQQTAALHSQIAEEVTRDGQRWISETIVNGASVLRMMIISYLTEERHLHDLETTLETAARIVTSRAH